MPCLYFQNLDISKVTPAAIVLLRHQLSLDLCLPTDDITFYYTPGEQKIITDLGSVISAPVKVTIEWFGTEERNHIKKFIAEHLEEFLAKSRQNESWNLVFLDMPAKAFYFEGELVIGGISPTSPAPLA